MAQDWRKGCRWPQANGCSIASQPTESNERRAANQSLGLSPENLVAVSPANAGQDGAAKKHCAGNAASVTCCARPLGNISKPKKAIATNAACQVISTRRRERCFITARPAGKNGANGKSSPCENGGAGVRRNKKCPARLL